MGVRIFLPEPLAAGAIVDLPQGQSRHVQVLRLQPGDPIALFSGDDGVEWTAEIVRMDRRVVQVRVMAAQRVERELPLPVTLAFGVPANERMDALVEKATELGVAAIQPLLCERSVVRLAGDRAEARREHWNAVAAAACEQSGRARLPRIGVPIKLDQWLRGLRDGKSPGDPSPTTEAVGEPNRRIVLSFEASAASTSTFAGSPRGTAPAGYLVLSGPEGGLTPDEETAAVAAGFERLSLGPRVLRADTAPLAALAWLGLAGIGQSPRDGASRQVDAMRDFQGAARP